MACFESGDNRLRRGLTQFRDPLPGDKCERQEITLRLAVPVVHFDNGEVRHAGIEGNRHRLAEIDRANLTGLAAKPAAVLEITGQKSFQSRLGAGREDLLPWS